MTLFGVYGVDAVPILVGAMLIVSKRSTMGDFTAPRVMKIFDWATTGVSTPAVIGMVVGVKTAMTGGATAGALRT